MNTRNRPPEQRPARPTSGDAAAGSDNSHLRERGRDLVGAANRAIDDALSSDSAQFLRTSVQSGGQ